MASTPLARFKLIVSLDGVNVPLYSGTLVGSRDSLANVKSVVSTILTDDEGNLSIVVVRLSSADKAPDGPVSSPSAPEACPLILTDQDGNILVWP